MCNSTLKNGFLAKFWSFLAVQNSSIGNLVTHSLTESLTDWVTFTFAIQRAILETCYHWDIWSEWWGDMTWLKIFQKFTKFQKIWKFSENLNIFFKNLKIFQKSENFPKIWKFSENLKIFQKSENFPKIWKFSENLKIFRKSENFRKSEKFSEKKFQTLWNRKDFIDVPLACEDSLERSQSELSNGLKFITYSFEDMLEQQIHHWCTPGLWR